jgi:hypothetical protein
MSAPGRLRPMSAGLFVLFAAIVACSGRAFSPSGTGSLESQSGLRAVDPDLKTLAPHGTAPPTAVWPAPLPTAYWFYHSMGWAPAPGGQCDTLANAQNGYGLCEGGGGGIEGANVFSAPPIGTPNFPPGPTTLTLLEAQIEPVSGGTMPVAINWTNGVNTSQPVWTEAWGVRSCTTTTSTNCAITVGVLNDSCPNSCTGPAAWYRITMKILVNTPSEGAPYYYTATNYEGLAGNGTAPNPTPSPNIVIVDVNNGNAQISPPNTPFPIIAGQQLHVAVQNKNGGGGNPTSVKWSFPSTAVGNYIFPSAGASTPPVIVSPSPNATDLTFYWIAGGSQKLSVVATYGTQQFVANAQYNPSTLTHVNLTAVTYGPIVGNFPANGVEQYGLAYSAAWPAAPSMPYPSPGMQMNMTATTPQSSSAGEMQFTQLVALCLGVIEPAPGPSGYFGTFPASGTTTSPFFLDTAAPYLGTSGVELTRFSGEFLIGHHAARLMRRS